MRGQCGENGQGGNEKKCINCLQIDVLAFGIAGDWKVTVLKAGVRVEMAIKGGKGVWPRRSKMRKTQLDFSRIRERQKIVTVQESVETPKRHQQPS